MSCVVGRNASAREVLVENLKSGDTVIVNDTANAIGRANDFFNTIAMSAAPAADMAVRSKFFIATYDEADTKFRREDKSTQLEISVERFLHSRTCPPLLLIDMSGTLVANVFKIPRPDIFFDRHAIFTKPGAEYVGTDMIDTFKDAGGQDLYLAHGELTVGNMFSSKNTKLAMADAARKPRSLLIVMVTSRQNAASKWVSVCVCYCCTVRHY